MLCVSATAEKMIVVLHAGAVGAYNGRVGKVRFYYFYSYLNVAIYLLRVYKSFYMRLVYI